MGMMFASLRARRDRAKRQVEADKRSDSPASEPEPKTEPAASQPARSKKPNGSNRRSKK